MEDHPQRTNWVPVLIVALALLLFCALACLCGLAGYLIITPTTSEEVPVAEPSAPAVIERPTAPAPPLYFTANQVIVIGPRDQIAEVIAEVNRRLDIELRQAERLDVDYFLRDDDPRQGPPGQEQQLPGSSNWRPENVLTSNDAAPASAVDSLLRRLQTAADAPAIDLYRIIDGRPYAEQLTVEQVVREINETAARRGVPVLADPNYVTGRAPVEIQGDPMCPEADPAGTPGNPVQNKQDFRKQWALGPLGIGLYSDAPTPTKTVNFTGAGVRIGVFDTSPFDLPQSSVTFESLNWDVQPFEVAGAPDVRDHGLFVAGLIREVAPDSEIHMFRVLNESARGDLFSLHRGLNAFIRDTLKQQNSLKGVVINLSLGVHQPADPADSGLLKEVASLEALLYRAYRLGAVIVAASGNDSGDLPGSAKPMQIPASYPFVIGVAASNIDDGRACFSNAGDLAAPGGDGKGLTCEPMASQCAQDDRYCLIGPALYAAPDTHFAYWNGTSFAAPLVSGLAAMVLEANAGNYGAQPPAAVSADVVSQIEGGTCPAAPLSTGLGLGVVNAPHTLLGAPCPAP